jgi:predicted nucleic acid-binding protein
VRIALDTNVLAYAEGVNTRSRQAAARTLLRSLARGRILLPVQVLGELFAVLVRKADLTPAKARPIVMGWAAAVQLIDTSPEVISDATELARDHQLYIWDAVIVAASARAGCSLLLSEDMHDGFVWSGVTVANPFATVHNPLLAKLLNEIGSE